MKAAQFFNRNNQYWKKKSDGKILMINLRERGTHYDGESHIFLKDTQFYEGNSREISEAEFKKVLKKHLKRLTDF